MIQYALSYTDGEVFGFVDSDRMPDLPPGQIAHVIVARVPCFPRMAAPTTKLYVINGELQKVGPDEVPALRAEKNAEINAWKLEANNTYFDFQGKQIAYRESDRVEIQAINNVVLLTGEMPTDPDWPAAWKTVDNTWLPLPDVETWKAFNLAIAARGTAHFKRAQELKSDLATATTPAEIDAIRW